jgi:predicted RNA-binding Zn-ribbon protein involved in translation (DUF1610 family)
MKNTVYTHTFKAVECPSCGAPVVTDPNATAHQCTFCHAQLDLRPRRRESPEQPNIDEASRQAGLRAQQRSPDPNSPLLYRAPDGLETFAAMLYDPSARDAGMAAIRQDWEQTRKSLESDPDDREDGVRFFRLAILLSNFYALGQHHEHARAVLETAVDLCPESGQRDILRCSLARAALDAGDVQAYEAWIGDCDPRPIHLEVDTHLRIARARYHLSTRQWHEALTELGYRAGDRPTSSDGAALVMLLRAHAHAGMGNVAAAQNNVRELNRMIGVEALGTLSERNPGPAQPYVTGIVRARGTSPIDPQAAQRAAKVAGAAATGAGGTVGCFALAMVLVPAIFALVLPSVFTVYADCGGSTQPYQAAVALANQCPTATQILGPNIAYTPGFSCGNCETSGSSGNMSWSVPVSGDIDSGRIDYTATHSGGPWELWTATLDTDRGGVDLIGCARGGATTSSQITITGSTGPSTVAPTPGSSPSDPVGGFRAMLEAQCAAGNGQMCIVVGAMYEQGNNAPQDLAQARAFYQKACDLGDSAGCTLVNQLGP